MPRDVCEVVAESVASAVCSRFGLDLSLRSVDYVAGGMGSWGRNYRAHIGGSICPDDINPEIRDDWRRCRKIGVRQVAARVSCGEWGVYWLE
jgi:hypothetical protein